MSEASSSPAENAATQPTAQGKPGWFLFLGIVFVVCGSFAMLVPLVSTLAVTLVTGVSLVVAGIAQTVQAFSKSWRGFFLHILLGVVYVVGGVAFWFNPMAGAFAIAALLSWVLLAQGVGEIALAFRIRPKKGWVWLVVSGIVALIASAWLIFRLPVAGFFVPGIIFGVALLFEGWAFIAIALSGRRPAADRPEPVQVP